MLILNLFCFSTCDRSLGPLSILVAVIVSVILIVIPREAKEKSLEDESVVRS